MEFQVHGALVEVLGVGVLLRGDSSVGKSECALELVQRGHRLVADDVVRLVSRSQSDSAVLMGHSPALIRHYVEIRGIGLLDVHALYGDGAVREREASTSLLPHQTRKEQHGRRRLRFLRIDCTAARAL